MLLAKFCVDPSGSSRGMTRLRSSRGMTYQYYSFNKLVSFVQYAIIQTLKHQ